MGESRFADEYEDDAQFYDGLEDHPGSPYPTIYDMPREGWAADVLRGRSARARGEALDLPTQLLTPEEFMRKYGLGRP